MNDHVKIYCWNRFFYIMQKLCTEEYSSFHMFFMVIYYYMSELFHPQSTLDIPSTIKYHPNKKYIGS
jgi:hypothetical protein